jgi:hypothetical protein
MMCDVSFDSILADYIKSQSTLQEINSDFNHNFRIMLNVMTSL